MLVGENNSVILYSSDLACTLICSQWSNLLTGASLSNQKVADGCGGDERGLRIIRLRSRRFYAWTTVRGLGRVWAIAVAPRSAESRRCALFSPKFSHKESNAPRYHVPWTTNHYKSAILRMHPDMHTRALLASVVDAILGSFRRSWWKNKHVCTYCAIMCLRMI